MDDPTETFASEHFGAPERTTEPVDRRGDSSNCRNGATRRVVLP